MFEQIMTLISSVGFPCAVCMYFIYKIEPSLNTLTQTVNVALTSLTQTVNELKNLVHSLHSNEKL